MPDSDGLVDVVEEDIADLRPAGDVVGLGQ
jgi:hypothetical protein